MQFRRRTKVRNQPKKLMNKKLRYISQKIDAIQLGLLRYHDEKDRITMHVKARTDDDHSLICTISSNDDLKKLKNKNVNFIQKSDDDYLYVSGQVKEISDRDKKEVFISILKACWYVRKSRGSLSWLQEKHIYNIFPQVDLELAS
jgi:general stress protein 26